MIQICCVAIAWSLLERKWQVAYTVHQSIRSATPKYCTVQSFGHCEKHRHPLFDTNWGCGTKFESSMPKEKRSRKHEEVKRTGNCWIRCKKLYYRLSLKSKYHYQVCSWIKYCQLECKKSDVCSMALKRRRRVYQCQCLCRNYIYRYLIWPHPRWVKRKSVRTGEPENSGFNKTQLWFVAYQQQIQSNGSWFLGVMQHTWENAEGRPAGSPGRRSEI